MFVPEKNIFSILAQAGPVFAKNLKFLAVITLLAFVPVSVFRMLLPAEYATAYFDFVETWTQALLAGADGQALAALAASPPLQGATTFLMMFYGIELAFFPLSTAAATYLVARHLAKEKPTFDGMFTAALPRLPKMLFTTAIVAVFLYLMLSLGGVFLIVLTIYFAVGMVFYQQVVTDMGRWGLGAISLSRFIIRRRWFKVFFGSLIIIILYFAASVLMEILTAVLGIGLGVSGNPLVHLPLFLLQHFLLSFFAIAFSLWYFDIKRFHKFNSEELEKLIMDRMRQQMEKFGPKEEDEENEED